MNRPREGDAISIYAGEFLISPIPLELSGNWCSHHCQYCFANLNKSGRWFDVERTQKVIARAMDGQDGLIESLLRDGYPVLCSNRVDPFSASNDAQMIPVMHTLQDCGIPVSIQTRGGRNAIREVSSLNSGLWYISICQDDDRLRKKLEPGAPSISSRFELIEIAANAGHNVVLGMNPLVPDWIPEPREMLKRAAGAGAKGVWIGWLHFNHDQISSMSERGRESLSPWLSDARKRHPDMVTAAVIDEAVAAAREFDLKFYVSGGYPEYGGLWDLFRENYEKTFPTIDDWTEACGRMPREQLNQGPITFDEFFDFMGKRLPDYGGRQCRDYIRIRRAARMGRHREAANYREVMEAIWSDKVFKVCPVHQPCFSWLGEKSDGGDPDEWDLLTDECDRPLLVYGHAESADQFFVSEWRC